MPRLAGSDVARCAAIGRHGLRIIEELHLERPAEGHYLEGRTPFDHGDPRERSGILLAKLGKQTPGAAPVHHTAP